MNYTRETIRLFWHHITKYPGYTTALIVGTPLTVLFSQFLPPLVLANVMDRLSKGDYYPDDLIGSFGQDLAIYAGLVLIGTIIVWRLIVIFVWKLEANVQRDLSQRVFSHLISQSATFHANHFGGSLVSQTTKLNSAYVRLADTMIFQVIPLFAGLLFATIILLPKAPIYVAGLLAFSIIYMVSALFITRKVRRLNGEEATAQSKQTGLLADAVTNVMAIKSFSSSKREDEKFAQATSATRNKTLDVMREATKNDFFFSTVTGIIQVMSLAVAAASVVLFNAEIATVFLILNYTASIGQQLWSFSGATMRNYNRSMGDAKDMVEILHSQPEVTDPAQPEQPRISAGEIAFKDVIFTHDGSQDALFEKLNLVIKPGEKIGLVGHSGSGKTTLTRILLRFSDIDGGEILVDGQNIAHLTQDDLRKHIAYVPQEPLLFHRSIGENIAYGMPNASDKQIREAARKANAAEFIDKLEHGYETLVGERGVKLSGGQRQRIVIARAILKEAPILILDEATSALDSESELLIQDALQELMKERTAIVIAHRLSTIQKMDRIVVLEKGAIVEQGSHNELVSQKGVYAQLWAHQSGGFIEE